MTILRVAIGWHLLYEGLTKLLNPDWTASGFLQSATGPLAGMFRAMAENDTLLALVNILNTWGLLLIGLGLFLGLFTRISQVAGMALLLLYYLSHPPVFTEPGFFREGSYFIISKDLLEIFGLLGLMFFPTGQFLGLDGLLSRMGRKPMHLMDHGQPEADETKANVHQIRRREVLKHLATIPFLGAVVYGAIRKTRISSLEEKNLVDATSSPTQEYVRKIMAGSNSVDLQNLKIYGRDKSTHRNSSQRNVG